MNLKSCMLSNIGWKIERQLEALHCTVLPSHTLESADLFVDDLREACQRVKVNAVCGAQLYLISSLVSLNRVHFPTPSVIHRLMAKFCTKVHKLGIAETGGNDLNSLLLS